MMRYLIVVAVTMLFALSAAAMFKNVSIDTNGEVVLGAHSDEVRLNHVWIEVYLSLKGCSIRECMELENITDYAVQITPGFNSYIYGNIDGKSNYFTVNVNQDIVERNIIPVKYPGEGNMYVCKMVFAAREKKYLRGAYFVDNTEPAGFPLRMLNVDMDTRGWQNDNNYGGIPSYMIPNPLPENPVREVLVTINIPGRTMVDTGTLEMKHVENRLYYKWDIIEKKNIRDIYFTYQPVIAGELRTTLINAREEKRRNANGYPTEQVANLDIIENPGKTLPSYAPETLLRDDVVYTKIDVLADNMLALNPKGKVTLKIDKGMTGAVLTACNNVFSFTTGSKVFNKDGVETTMAGAPFLLDDPFNAGEKVLYVPLSPVVDFYKGKLTLTKELAKVSYSLPEWEPKEAVKHIENEEMH